MIVLLIFSFLALALALFAMFKGDDKNEKIFILFLYSLFKKRNFDENKVKNSSKTPKQAEKSNKITFSYKPLKTYNISKKLLSISKCERKTYVELALKNKTKTIVELVSRAEKKLNSSSEKYRSFQKETMVESLANFFSHEIISQENYDVFENFKKLSSVFKIYKKESDILGALLSINLATIYFKMLAEISADKKLILRGASATRLKSSASFQEVYGAFLFNKNSTKIFSCGNFNINLSTTLLIQKLDESLCKMKLIYRHINFLLSEK